MKFRQVLILATFSVFGGGIGPQMTNRVHCVKKQYLNQYLNDYWQPFISPVMEKGKIISDFVGLNFGAKNGFYKEIAGVGCFEHFPKSGLSCENNDANTILYIHGGGFGENTGHDNYSDFVQHLANELNSKIVYIEYSVNDKYPKAIDECEKVCSEILNSVNHISILGDSTGGNLAVTLSIRMLQNPNNIKNIKHIFLLNPILQLYQPSCSFNESNIITESFKLFQQNSTLSYYGKPLTPENYNLLQQAYDSHNKWQPPDIQNLSDFTMNPEVSPLLSKPEMFEKLSQDYRFFILTGKLDPSMCNSFCFASKLQQNDDERRNIEDPKVLVRRNGFFHGWIKFTSAFQGSKRSDGKGDSIFDDELQIVTNELKKRLHFIE